MNRETLVTIAAALLVSATEEDVREVENLCFIRRRSLREDAVQRYVPGQQVVYFSRDGRKKREATIHHLNKYSLTVEYTDWQGARALYVVPIERVIGLAGEVLT